MIITPILFSLSSLYEASNLDAVAPPVWAKQAYGEKLEFIINRNDKSVGRHIVEFDQSDGLVEVTSSTKIDIKFLFITAYKFRLEAKEYWSKGNLARIDSSSNDGGKKSELSKVIAESQEILPTSHWNPSVLTNQKVYNTITGKTNLINIHPMGWEKVSTGTGIRDAFRYDYHGDLNDVSAWYDKYGRWVSLRFKARDGSTISYECVQCGA